LRIIYNIVGNDATGYFLYLEEDCPPISQPQHQALIASSADFTIFIAPSAVINLTYRCLQANRVWIHRGRYGDWSRRV